MKNFLFGLMAIVATLGANAQSKAGELSENRVGVTCHEVSVSIASIVTVNNIYVCCGGPFINNLVFPPRMCGFVSKRFFDLYQASGERHGNGQSINIKDLIPDGKITNTLTEIIVEKSTAFEYDGKLCAIKPGKYQIDSKGEVYFEITTLKK